MKLTEKEAKHKYCWKNAAKGFHACEASQCMAWRWSSEIRRTEVSTNVHSNQLTGYCGLAGKPEGDS